ncbi:MAG: PilZ domain-containing protein [bacterium]
MKNKKFKPVKAKTDLKFLINRTTEATGQLNSISAGCMNIQSDAHVQDGDHIIAYLQGVERFEGTVRALSGKQFALQLDISYSKRERLIESLTYEIACKDGLIEEKNTTFNRRGSKRRKAYNSKSSCVLEDGTTLRCSVIDLSLTGVAIEIAPILKLGEVIRIGMAKARVVRKIRNGYGLEFLANHDSDKVTEIFSKCRETMARETPSLPIPNYVNAKTVITA